MRTKFSLFCIFILSILLATCQPGQDQQTPDFLYEVADAPEWNQLFTRTQGWFGGDGIFTISLSGTDETNDTTRQLIIFSDTMLGEIKDSILQPGYHMVNNSVAFLKGKSPNPRNISFPVPKDLSGQDASVFPVMLSDKEEGEYYWLGDGFVNSSNGHTYIFAYRVIDRPEWTDTKFKFEILGGALIILPPDSSFPFNSQRQISLPFFQNSNGITTTFGVAIFENNIEVSPRKPDGYIYIYGTRDPHKQVLVGRVQPEEVEKFERWNFWNGSDWISDFKHAQAIADSASNELSVSPLPNGQYALISQLNGIYPMVIMRLGESPVGPFGKTIKLWDCQADLVEPEFFAYNAKAHPSLSGPGELLISYNVNSFAFWDQIEKHPNLYRPRFFKLIFN